MMGSNRKKLYLWIVIVTSSALTILIVFKLFEHHSSKPNPTAHITAPISKSEMDIRFGTQDATLELFLFFNYNCAHCQNFFNDAFSSLKSEFIDTKKITLVLKPVEVEQHPDVMYALQTAICVNKFGSFDKLHELLIYNPSVMYSEEFKDLTDDFINFDPSVAECLLDNNDYSYLKSNLLDFYKNNMTATPTFVINNNIYKGFKDSPTLMRIIRKELKYKTQKTD